MTKGQILFTVLANEAIMVEVIDGEGVGGLLLRCSLQENVQPEDPFLPSDRPVALRVKELEDPVHEDVVRHVERIVEELSECVSVHRIQFNSVVPGEEKKIKQIQHELKEHL